MRESDAARRRLGPRCRCNARPRPTSCSIATQAYAATVVLLSYGEGDKGAPNGLSTTAGFEASSAESNASSQTSRRLLPAARVPGVIGPRSISIVRVPGDEVRAPVVCLAWAVRVRGR